MEDTSIPSPAFLAMQTKLAAKKAGNGDSEKKEVEKKEVVSISKSNIRYYKSHSPSFNCIYNKLGQETVHIRFVNSVYSTNNENIKQYLYYHFVKRGYIIEISEDEFKDNTSIQKAQPKRSFVDVASTTIKVGMADSGDVIE